MKGKIIRTVILTLVFVLALIGFGAYINRGESAEIVAMDAATLPMISFECRGYQMNRLHGYLQEMNIPAMRDTITPLENNGSITLCVQDYGTKYQTMKVQMYTLDGKEVLAEENYKEPQDKFVLKVGEELEEGVEAVLKVTIRLNSEKEVRYYTRIAKVKDYAVSECLKFAKDLHTNMLAKNKDMVEPYLEMDETADNTTLHEVNIHSDVTQAMWGEMKPKVVGEIQWELKETNATYNSILLKYKVSAKEEDTQTSFYVKEFFKVRKLGKKYYLLTYERTMNEILDTAGELITVKGINLGVSDSNVTYQTSEDGEKAAFVKNGELWAYDRSKKTLSRVFSFADGDDVRGEYDQHDIEIVDMDKDGNLIFMVYGYMNRGEHEGEVGVAIYQYRHAYSIIEEKIFLSSDKAYAVAAEELCKLVYYNAKDDCIYLMMDEQLVSKNLLEDTTKVLAKELTQNKYTLSDDGRFVAYQTEYDKVTLLDFSTHKKVNLSAADGETICPMAFVDDDLIVGYMADADKGKTLSGSSIAPSYKLEIYDKTGALVKTYQQSGIMVSDVFVTDNMVTLKRVKKVGEKYQGVKDDYITNHEEQKEENITLESYSNDSRQRQYRLAFANRIEEDNTRIRYPKQMLSKNVMRLDMHSEAKDNCYYVYGAGEMAGVFDQAGYAVQKADEIEGVVVSTSQTYVWERGNYQGWYQIPGLYGRARKSSETTLEVCLELLLAYEDASGAEMDGSEPIQILKNSKVGEVLDLTGCDAEDLCYIIGKGTPVLAMKDSKNAYLLIGYQGSTVVYIDAADGKIKTQSMKKMDEMTEGSGHTYIGYAKAQEYH